MRTRVVVLLKMSKFETVSLLAYETLLVLSRGEFIAHTILHLSASCFLEGRTDESSDIVM